METALEQAKIAYRKGEVPVGAVVVKGSSIVSVGHNLRETTADPTAHAEILAIRDASQILGSWRLNECDLYVTLEPCVMCAGAIVNSRLRGVFFGAADHKTGALQSLYGIASDPRLNHEAKYQGGYRDRESAELLRNFFIERRS